MHFRFSAKVTVIGSLLILGMLRMSYWQWERHQWKINLIDNLRSRLELPITDLHELAQSHQENWSPHIFRRVRVAGTYDFEHEILLRNRKFKHSMGVHAITPLLLDGTDIRVLVDRGFIPLSKSELSQRRIYQSPAHMEFVGLIKESVPQKFMAPSDPPSGSGLPWVERWLRVDIENIQRQLPYAVLPIFLEIVETADMKAVEQSIVDESTSGRDEIFFLNADQKLGTLSDDVANGAYPVPVFDTVIPPGRHFGYIFEWAAMALLTLLICLILQLRRPRAET